MIYTIRALMPNAKFGLITLFQTFLELLFNYLFCISDILSTCKTKIKIKTQIINVTNEHSVLQYIFKKHDLAQILEQSDCQYKIGLIKSVSS